MSFQGAAQFVLIMNAYKTFSALQFLFTYGTLFMFAFHGQVSFSNPQANPAGHEFRATLALSANDAELRKNWEANSGSPKLDVLDTTKLNSPVTTVVLFEGCRPGPDGKCDVFVQFAVTDPAGVRKLGSAGQLWSSRPIDNKLMLGAYTVTLNFTDPSSTGQYLVHALLTDRVSGENLEIATPLKVVR